MTHMRRALLATFLAVVLLAVLTSVLRPGGPLIERGGRDLIDGRFSLITQDGTPVTQDSWPGQFLLVYFGFTYCPDVCPTALVNMAMVLDLLEDDAARVQPLFFTVDPERDTPEALEVYVSAFHPRLVGLTGSADAVAQAAAAYQVRYGKVEDPQFTDYLVDHSSVIYLMDPGGRYVTHFTHETAPERMAEVIGRHLADTPTMGETEDPSP